MLINGQPAKSNLPNILKQLEELPSNFPNYNSRNIVSVKVTAFLKEQWLNGYEERSRGNFTKAIGFYEKAITEAL